jgi:hypothetical protein
MSFRSFAVLGALVALVAVRPAAAAPVRVFAVGNEVRVEDVVNVQAFRAKMFALVDATLPNRANFVQAGSTTWRAISSPRTRVRRRSFS